MIKVILAHENNVRKLNVEYERNMMLSELLTLLNVDISGVGAILVNDVPKKKCDKFEDGDTIYILPILQGG